MSINEELFYTLRRSNACLRRKHDGGSGCHGGSGRILDFLDESVGVSQQQLADTLCLRPQSVSERICRLEQLGWILKKQSESDRRQFLIFITEEGKQARENIREERKKRAERFFGVLTEEEKEELLRLLKKVNSEWEGYYAAAKTDAE